MTILNAISLFHIDQLKYNMIHDENEGRVCVRRSSRQTREPDHYWDEYANVLLLEHETIQHVMNDFEADIENDIETDCDDEDSDFVLSDIEDIEEESESDIENDDIEEESDGSMESAETESENSDCELWDEIFEIFESDSDDTEDPGEVINFGSEENPIVLD